MTSTRLSELNLTETRSAQVELRVHRVRAAIRSGSYDIPAELVAEAVLASSLVGLPPNPRSLAWAC